MWACTSVTRSSSAFSASWSSAASTPPARSGRPSRPSRAARWCSPPRSSSSARSALVIAEVTSFASFLLGQAILTSPARHATLASPGALRAVAGIGLFLCVGGLLALGIAAVVRHTAGAIGAYVFVMLVLPIIVAALPKSIGNDLERFLPMAVGSVMINNPVPNAFGPWTGFAILCGYTAAVLALGTVLLVRRDA